MVIFKEFLYKNPIGRNKNGANNYSFSEANYNAGACGFGYTLTKNNEIPQGDPVYDAARKNMGEPWMIPTHTQVLELRHRNNTISEWTTINGKNGRKFTNKMDSTKYIFLPAAGSWNGTNHNEIQTWGHYWSTSLNDYKWHAWHLYFYSDDCDTRSVDHWLGMSIRPVAQARPW